MRVTRVWLTCAALARVGPRRCALPSSSHACVAHRVDRDAVPSRYAASPASIADDAAAPTILWNICDATVAVAPVLTVDPQLDQPRDSDIRDAPAGSAILERGLYGGKTTSGAPLYDVSQAQRNLPVGVQLVGAPYEDEKVLAMLRELDTALGPRSFGPGQFARRRG